MLKYIQLNGKQYPVTFGHATLFDFEDNTGIEVFKMGSAGNELKHNDFMKLCFFGLKHGHRIEKLLKWSFSM